MKRALLMMLTCLLAACSSLIGPREVDLPLSRLQREVARRFPLDERYLGLLDVHAANPALALRPESGRIALALDVSIASALTGSLWQGSVTLSGVPRLDVGRGLLALAEPRIDDIRGAGIDNALGGQVARVASFLAAQIVGEVPVHRFQSTDFRFAGVSFVPVKIDTRADRLVVTFEPVK
jgi:hypothetical protein